MGVAEVKGCLQLCSVMSQSVRKQHFTENVLRKESVLRRPSKVITRHGVAKIPTALEITADIQ